MKKTSAGAVTAFVLFILGILLVVFVATCDDEIRNITWLNIEMLAWTAFIIEISALITAIVSEKTTLRLIVMILSSIVVLLFLLQLVNASGGNPSPPVKDVSTA